LTAMTGHRVGSHPSEGGRASVHKIAMFCTTVMRTPPPGQHFCLTLEYMDEVESARHTWLTPSGLAEALPKPDKPLS